MYLEMNGKLLQDIDSGGWLGACTALALRQLASAPARASQFASPIARKATAVSTRPAPVPPAVSGPKARAIKRVIFFIRYRSATLTPKRGQQSTSVPYCPHIGC